MAVTVTIVNGANRGDFTAGTGRWTRRPAAATSSTAAPSGPGERGRGGDHGGRTLVFDPRENAIAPGTTETTTFTVSVDDSGAAVSNDDTISPSPPRSTTARPWGEAANQAVNDNATLSVFSTLTVTDPDNESVAVTVTIVNGADRATSPPVRQTGPAAPAAATSSTAAPSRPRRTWARR